MPYTQEQQQILKEDLGLPGGALDDKYNPEGDGEHPVISRQEWRDAVAQQDTISGYWDWLTSQIDNRLGSDDSAPADETDGLWISPANAKRLRESIAEPKEGKTVARPLLSVRPATPSETIAYLEQLELATALWWFIENLNEEPSGRSEIFFSLRERMRLARVG